MNLKKYFLVVFVIGASLLSNDIVAQITPPGMSSTNMASWFAVGIRQELDTIPGKGWQSMTYAGIGLKSNPDNYNLVQKPAIFVVNQEFYHQFHHHWQYSIGLSYRRQDKYQDISPYEHLTPSIQQEFRFYSRLSYILKTSRLKFAPTFRQEFRRYFEPNFKNPTEIYQFRSRIRLQLTVNLNTKKTHRLIFSSEQLFSISRTTTPSKWTNFNYRESRFSLYYSYSPEKLPFIVNIGYMNNLVGTKTPTTNHSFGFDIIIENPFKLRQRSKENIYENLE